MIVFFEMKKNILIILLTITGIGQSIIAQDNMILISGGSYKMGDFTGKGFANERPIHDVFLDSFYIGKNQLTVGEFRDFVEESGYITDCEMKKGGKIFLIENGQQKFYHDSLASWKYVGYIPNNNQPVTFVSWADAINYCNWRSEKENLKCCYKIMGDLELGEANKLHHCFFCFYYCCHNIISDLCVQR